MKFLGVLLLGTCMTIHANTLAQQTKVTLDMQKVSLVSVLKELGRQTQCDFIYNSSLIQSKKNVDVKADNKELVQILDELLPGLGLEYVFDKQLVVVREKSSQQKTEIRITGKVLDEKQQPMPGVTVVLKGTTVGIATDNKGEFTLTLPVDNGILVFSFIGCETNEVSFKGQPTSPLTVILKEEVAELSEVVVTGMFTRKAESFTGTTTTVKGVDLRAIGNQNLLQSLRSLDPSFLVIENNLSGSNPNTMPNVEIRGTTSINKLTDEFGYNPNQPLFILDGFETTMQKIFDLDMNRIESVTILKDAASTAIYGSRAANGVVVVETIKPKAGEVRVSYTGDFRIEAPDLSSYNLMNSAEKLEFERLAGRYKSNMASFQEELNNIYYKKLAEIRRGVDSYWLSEPVQTGYTVGNSIQVSGGSEGLAYGVGLSYKTINGVMKGSDRKPWGANINLAYRQKSIQVSNYLSLDGLTSNNSPYAPFSDFVKVNPYYRKRNEEGVVEKYLENSSGTYNGQSYIVANPLYNALLPHKDETNSFGFNNNLKLIWTINPQWRVDGALQIGRTTSDTEIFLAPEHSSFDNSGIYEKGSYSSAETESSNYTANISVSYSATLKEKHNLTVNSRAEVAESKYSFRSFTALGFPPGSDGHPAYSFGYDPNGKPAASNVTVRRANLVFSSNYTYDNRYLADFSFRYDGSTVFGSNEKFTSFYSVGLGWNLHNESFLKQVEWLNLLKITANVGTVGNQNMGSTLSATVYTYSDKLNFFGQGSVIEGLGNPGLEWQKTQTSNLSLDMTIFNNRLSTKVSVWEKKTDPLVVAVDKPSSTGVKKHPMNIGYLDSKGIEAMINVVAYRRTTGNRISDRTEWRLGLQGSHLKSLYGGFGNQLESLNNVEQANNSLERFKDGYSPEDLWAVRSVGIDPGTGREVFVTKDGEQTFSYNTNDIVKAGNTRPKVEGTFNTSFSYKGLTLQATFRYRLGGDLLNDALYNKIENIGIEEMKQNQDKRALYMRWKNPGDVAQFKAISLITTDAQKTRISSRFIQKDNIVTGESISLSWAFDAQSWIRHLSMQSLKITAYTNEFLRLSNVKAERGIDYPFARSFSLGISASF